MTIFKPTLRARIFISLTFMIFVSFVLTGLISLYHFEEENEEYHQERLKRKEYAIESNIQYFLASHPEKQQTDSLSALFSDKICELSDVHNLDINFFSPEGKLLITNNSHLFDVEILPETVPKEILSRIVEGERRFILPSSDTTDVLLIYSILYTSAGEPLAILNLPYFEPNNIPEQDLEFLETLIGLYIILFLAAVLLAYFLSNYITHSLIAITKKMREVKLGRNNEPIQWRSKDEIGALVDEYNKMMKELEDYAIKLAQSERETAWKEMAKQVAHEIKNPLTPMRLSVQMLERKLEVSEPQKLQEFTESMIAQIDALSNIATAFSRFASMPEMKKEKIDIKAFLERINAAHEVVHLDLPETEITIEGDKDQLTRVLNNLILNAEQAMPENREPHITVGFKELDSNHIEIFVKDNGVGIPESRREKVFEPSFTTKTTGMGLGLAMVKNIVNGFKGEITFTSVVDEGTTFHVRLPKSIKETE
ncbi:MAG: two-component sensor histidine kinase [Flavobacteriia bacterium]|nr:two-component sensor histidine kinase [Flavobacteriia bacterium]